MKWDHRDQWICVILPPVLTAALLFWLILRPLFADVSALRESIPEQRRLIFAPEAQDQLRAEQQRLETSMAGEQKLIEAAGAVFKKNYTENRVMTLQAITRLCESSDLTLLAVQRDEQTQFPQILQSLAQALTEHSGATSPQFWRLELQGSYANMVRILDALSTIDELVIPVSLSMELGVNGNSAAMWTLKVWI